jgi:putative peptidoglycan lipid II flippase
MKPEGQTAIRGVISVGATNIAVRVLGYAKHVLIAAFIGLSAQLDAFYMAFTVMSIAVFSFGDVFDSLGVPRLVQKLQREGDDSFRKLAGIFLVFSILLSLVLGIILILVAPWAPGIAPGFSAEKKAFVYRSLLYLYPIVILYLPLHAIGSFLRSKRRFLTFYSGELVFASVSLGVVYWWRDLPFVVPISVTVATGAAFLYVYLVGRRYFYLAFEGIWPELQEITLLFFRLLPIYLVGYLNMFVDRAFASYLPTGGVSALSYGLLIVMLPASILMIENIFITPLAESPDPDKGELMNRILNGAIITSVPLAVFTVDHANIIVKAALERGVFTAVSTDMTADALAYFGLSIPALFILPISYRLFQILGKIAPISIVGLGCVISNAIMNYLFLRMGLGIKGVALATSISNYLSVAGAAVLFNRFAIAAFTKKTLLVFLISVAVSMVALITSGFVPIGSDPVGGVIVRGIVFLLASMLLYSLVPNRSVKEWRDTVIRELSPVKK